MMNFSEWINYELERRGWSRSEAARRGGISPSMFDKVINGSSKPGLSFLKGISQAFEISLVEVLEMAGEYSPNPHQAEWDMVFQKLSPSEQQELLEIARMKLQRKRKADTQPLPRLRQNGAEA